MDVHLIIAGCMEEALIIPLAGPGPVERITSWGKTLYVHVGTVIHLATKNYNYSQSKLN